jgi:lysophospholipase L1-like esterase
MSSRWLAYFGLRQPYRFERTIIAAVAFVLVALVVATAVRLWAADQLHAGGPRVHYFLYLLVLLALSIAMLRWPWLSGSLVMLALVDLGWGVGSYALRQHTLGGYSLLPPDKTEPQRFQWHALLQAVPIPGLQFTTSTGLVVSHTSESTRGRDPSGSLAARTVIATYGGSTTYDIGLGEGDTWSDRLGQALGADRVFVVNHGMPGYTTAEHLIQTAFYQTKFGKPPRCAIYYVGWNDLRNAHIPHLDPGYADFHLPSQVDGMRTRRVGGSNVTISPLLTVALRGLSANIDTVQYSTDPYKHEPVGGDDPDLEAVYRRNIEAISAINRQHGIATIWVGQLLNRDQLSGEGRYGWLPRVRDRDLWLLQQKFNMLLAGTARALGDLYIDVPVDAFTVEDFIDNGHFSASGARRFVQYLAPAVAEACR